MPMSTRLLLLLLTLGIAGCAPLQRVPMGGAPADPAAAILDGGGYPTTVGDAAYAGRAAACSITGSGTRQAIRANLISGGQLYIGGTLLVAANGQVQAAGCLPAQPDAVQVDCPGALLSAAGWGWRPCWASSAGTAAGCGWRPPRTAARYSNCTSRSPPPPPAGWW